MADGSVTFVTELDNKKLEGQLQKLKKDIAKIEQNVAGAETEKSPLVQQAQELEQSIKMARAEAQKYRSEWRAGVVGADSNQSKAIERASQLESQYAEVVAQIEKIDKKLIPAYTRMDKLKEEAGGLEQRLSQAGVNAGRMDKATKKAQKSASRFALRMKEVVRSALVFTLISQALASFREWMGKVIRTNKEAAAAVAKLKGALLTLAQPLLKLLIPAFTAFVRIIASVVSALANIVSMLFGTTAQASSEAAEALQGETEALDGVGGAAKKAGKSLAGFDEINKLSGDSAGGSVGGGEGPDFGMLAKAELDKMTAYVSGALLAIGAILAFSGVNIPLGLGLMAVGALGLAAVIKENWGAMDAGLLGALTRVLTILGGFALVIGAILTLTGANIPLGIGLMIFGAAALASAVALNWEAMGDSLNEALGSLLIIIGGFIAVIGVILLLTGNIPLGLGLLLAGISLFAAGMIATNWDEMGGKIGETLGAIFVVIGGFLAVIGIILLLTGNVPLGLGLLIAGISIFAASAAAINGNIAADHVSAMLGAIFSIAGTAMLAIGLLLVLTGIGGPLGIGLMIAGGAALGAGAVALNWDWIIEKLNGMWSDITNWWDANAAQFFTADYWTDIGKHMLDGLFNGLSSIGSKISEWGSGFIDGVKDFFGIHSPSTEFETLGKYMMLGMEGGIDDNNEVVLAVFSGLLAQMLTMTQTTTDDMQALFAAILLYIMADFKSGWTSFWQYFQDASGQSIQNVMGKIDALNAKLASIERNIVITITTVHNTSGSSSPGSASILSSKARSASISTSQVPALARGAVIPPNREFMAVLGDQRSGYNIEAPEDLIRKIVREESGGGMNTELLRAILEAIREGKVMMVEYEQFAKLVFSANKSESRRIGVSLAGR